jgi:hypothetical protein
VPPRENMRTDATPLSSVKMISAMRRYRFLAVAAAAAFTAFACAKKEPAASEKPAAPAAGKIIAEKIEPYTYTPPVKGHYKEINIGSFDLVDGIAFTASDGHGTVVYTTSKAIASPVLAESPCPMTHARAISAMRSASYVEVTLDKAGHSNYFAAGKMFGGSSREQQAGGRYWSSSLKAANAGRAAGSVQHRLHGGFEFDLTILHPQAHEVGQGDWMEGKRADASASKPTEQALKTAYESVRQAVVKKDLKSLLTALGFNDKQAAAIRGLDGIDADFAVYSDRFLAPGTASDFTSRPGAGNVRSEGVNPQGKKFANYYWFAPCGDRLVLVSIAENPQ